MRGGHVGYLLLVALVQRRLQRHGHAPVLQNGALEVLRLLLRLLLHLNGNLQTQIHARAQKKNIQRRTVHVSIDLPVIILRRRRASLSTPQF